MHIKAEDDGAIPNKQEGAICDLVKAWPLVVKRGWNCTNGPSPNVCNATYGTWKGIQCQGNRVTAIDIIGAHLAGSIPSTIGYLTGLTGLFLQTNKLSGVIPTTIGYLTNLRWFQNYANPLRGTIPTSIGLLTNMNVLSFGSTLLTGVIPSSIGLMSNLWVFTADDNSLSGVIPSTFCVLIDTIWSMYLGHNNLACYPSCFQYPNVWLNSLVHSYPPVMCTDTPTAPPSQAPSAPSVTPTARLFRNPSHAPSRVPTTRPTKAPSRAPSRAPTTRPSQTPRAPTSRPLPAPPVTVLTKKPSKTPSKSPAKVPVKA